MDHANASMMTTVSPLAPSIPVRASSRPVPLPASERDIPSRDQRLETQVRLRAKYGIITTGKRRVRRPTCDERCADAISEYSNDVAVGRRAEDAPIPVKRHSAWRRGHALPVPIDVCPAEPAIQVVSADPGFPIVIKNEPVDDDVTSIVVLESGDEGETPKPTQFRFRPKFELNDWVLTCAYFRMRQNWSVVAVTEHLKERVLDIVCPWLSKRNMLKWLVKDKKVRDVDVDNAGGDWKRQVHMVDREAMIPVLAATVVEISCAGVLLDAGTMAFCF